MSFNFAANMIKTQENILGFYTWIVDNSDILTCDEINNADAIIKQVCADLLKFTIEPIKVNGDVYIKSYERYCDLVSQLNQKVSMV